MAKTPGQIAYEEDCKRQPKYHDKKPRKLWGNLPEYAKESWERNPTPRVWKETGEVNG